MQRKQITNELDRLDEIQGFSSSPEEDLSQGMTLSPTFETSDLVKIYRYLTNRLSNYLKAPTDEARATLTPLIADFYRNGYYHDLGKSGPYQDELNNYVLRFDLKNPLLKDDPDFMAVITSLTHPLNANESEAVQKFYTEKYDELKKSEQEILNRYASISDFDITHYENDSVSWNPKGLNASRLFQVYSHVSEEDRDHLYRNCERYLSSKKEQMQFYLLSERLPASESRIQRDREQFEEQIEEKKPSKVIEHSYSAQRLFRIFTNLSQDNQEFVFKNVDRLFLLDDKIPPEAKDQKLKFYDLALTYFINLHDPNQIEQHAQHCFIALKNLVKQPELITPTDLEEFYRKYYPHLPKESKSECNNLIAGIYSASNPNVCEALFTIAKNEKLRDTKRGWFAKARDNWNAMSTRMKVLTVFGVFLGLAAIAAAILFPPSLAFIAPAAITAGSLTTATSGTILGINLSSNDMVIPYKNSLQKPNQDELVFPTKAERSLPSMNDLPPPHGYADEFAFVRGSENDKASANTSQPPSTTQGRLLLAGTLSKRSPLEIDSHGVGAESASDISHGVRAESPHSPTITPTASDNSEQDLNKKPNKPGLIN